MRLCLWSANSLKRHPQIPEWRWTRLAGKMSEDEVRAMNEAVDGQHRDVAEVVREFRRSRGL